MLKVILRVGALLLFFLGASCSNHLDEAGQGRQTLTVFAASSLTDSFAELATAYAAEQPEVEVALNHAGSSQLAVQLREGARADLFASANPAQMETVVAGGRIGADAPVIFAQNRLVLIIPADNPAGLSAWEDLGQPGVHLVVAATGVPVRVYTDAVVDEMPEAFRRQFYANVVSEEPNVRQVAAKVALGEADAGIVYATDVTPEIAFRVTKIALPRTDAAVASYLIAPLNDAPQPLPAQQFIDFVTGPTGREILERWGFMVPDNG